MRVASGRCTSQWTNAVFNRFHPYTPTGHFISATRFRQLSGSVYPDAAQAKRNGKKGATEALWTANAGDDGAPRTVLRRRATVARPGMTRCPCLSHDPGGGVAGCGGVDGPLIGTRPTEVG
ncbi:hypothetical protein FXW78_15575 [Rhodococcus opacus]|nr:hypothetical protein [Rhodococcus opacus]